MDEGVEGLNFTVDGINNFYIYKKSAWTFFTWNNITNHTHKLLQVGASFVLLLPAVELTYARLWWLYMTWSAYRASWKPGKCFNPLNAELNPICHLLALLGSHPILHVSRIRVKYLKGWHTRVAWWAHIELSFRKKEI